MPALDNPRWEQFARCIVAGLANGDHKSYSQGRAYLAAGYEAKDAGKRGGSAEAAASRLLNKVKPILQRVKELQAEQLARLERKLDLSKERVGRRLDLASRIAEQQENASAIATSELGIAKVFGHLVDRVELNPTAIQNAQSLQDIGRALLVSAGLSSPPDEAIAAAVEAHAQFMSRLDEIREIYQGHVIEHEG